MSTVDPYLPDEDHAPPRNGHQGMPAVSAALRRSLDAICRAAHEETLELLREHDEDGQDAKSVRLAVYRSMRTLSSCEPALRSAFVDRVLERIDTLHLIDNAVARQKRSLRLMDEEELKQELLCATFVAQVDAITRPLLAALARALGSVDRQWLGRVDAALGPRAVLDAYLEAAAAVSFAADVRVVLLRQLHDHMIEGLPDAYRLCLRALGVSDVERIPVRQSARADRPVVEAVEALGGMPATSPMSTSGEAMAAIGKQPSEACGIAPSQEMLAAVLQLLARKAGAEAPPPQATWPRDQVIRALVTMQALERTPESVAGSGAAGLVELVERTLRSTSALRGGDKSLSEADRAVADLVGMLFDFLLSDQGIPVQLAPEFLKLRVPFLRLALEDRQLLIRRESAPRQLLETLARCSVEIVVESPRGAEMLAVCRTTVADVLEHYGSDVGVFAEIRAALERRYKLLKARGEKAERRVVDQAESRERLLAAWQAVARCVARELLKSDLPPVVHELIRRPWSQYLVLLVLRHGTESAEFRSAVDVAAVLGKAFRNWTTLPSRGPERAQHAMRQLASTAIALRVGLEAIGYPSNQVVLVWRCLTRLVVDARTAAASSSDDARMESIISPTGHDVDSALLEFGARMTLTELAGGAPAPAASGAVHSGVHATANVVAKSADAVASDACLEIGARVELNAPGKPPQRLKLCWKGVASGLHVFVNHAGVKTLELPASKVAAMLADGALSPCAAEPVVDRALVSIFQRLGAAK